MRWGGGWMSLRLGRQGEKHGPDARAEPEREPAVQPTARASCVASTVATVGPMMKIASSITDSRA